MIQTVAMGSEITTGNIRIQSLTPTLIRLEEKGPKGFEDRETFLVQNRKVGGECAFSVVREDDRMTLYETGELYVCLPHNAKRLSELTLKLKRGNESWKPGRLDVFNDLPAPSHLPDFWILPDLHRIIPSEAGAVPVKGDDPDSGWDVHSDARDVYVFLPASCGYETFRKEFLALTGSVLMLPLYTFGLWYSRYHPYSEGEALEVIDTFREKNIPLDVFVADTDWREGASHGYQVNTNLFPDMRRFIELAHEKGVRVVFNDHPEPAGHYALDPKEMQYRWDGLTSILALGMDAWWFDRNWHTHLHGVNAALRKEVWGMRHYHDITQAFRPGKRALIMSNVDGIDNGKLEYPTHPAAHRYPIWWTGDTLSNWQALERGIRNGVESGVYGLLPYVHEDLAGHIGEPDAELYLRFLQFGVFSPVARLHCTCGFDRYPWRYGPDMEQIAAGYIRLRYRLLPLIYTAAYHAWKDGQPLMRRCDLEWPEESGATDSLQYLFGDDLLVAPFFGPADKEQAETGRGVWIPPGTWEDAWNGEVHVGPTSITVRKPLEEMPLFVRRGGMLMETSLRQSTGQAAWPVVIVHVYPDASGKKVKRLLYEDDGESTGYLRGAFSRTEITQDQQDGILKLAVRPTCQNWRPPFETRDWTFCIHMGAEEALEHVQVSNADSEITYSLEAATHWIPGELRKADSADKNAVAAIKLKGIPVEQAFSVTVRVAAR